MNFLSHGIQNWTPVIFWSIILFLVLTAMAVALIRAARKNKPSTPPKMEPPTASCESRIRSSGDPGKSAAAGGSKTPAPIKNNSFPIYRVVGSNELDDRKLETYTCWPAMGYGIWLRPDAATNMANPYGTLRGDILCTNENTPRLIRLDATEKLGDSSQRLQFWTRSLALADFVVTVGFMNVGNVYLTPSAVRAVPPRAKA